MRRTTALAKGLLISLLTFLMIPSWSSSVSAGFNVWTSNGPEAGYVFALALDPQTPAIIYAGTESGEVFKSTDGGTSWSAIINGLAITRVFALAVDPQTPAIIYAGIWGGVFKSTDSGAHWGEINNGLTDTRVLVLALDPQTSTIIYAGTWGGSVFSMHQLEEEIYLPPVQKHGWRRELERIQ